MAVIGWRVDSEADWDIVLYKASKCGSRFLEWRNNGLLERGYPSCTFAVMLGETEGMKRESTSRVGVLCSRAVQSLRYVAVCSTSHLDRFQNVSMRSVRL